MFDINSYNLENIKKVYGEPHVLVTLITAETKRIYGALEQEHSESYKHALTFALRVTFTAMNNHARSLIDNNKITPEHLYSISQESSIDFRKMTITQQVMQDMYPFPTQELKRKILTKIPGILEPILDIYRKTGTGTCPRKKFAQLAQEKYLKQTK